MQNRYTGDIGDFSKLGLLRALQRAGFSIGLNWYLTPDETHNSDGRHVDYLYQSEYHECDLGLWTELGNLVKLGNRQVCYMENDNILQAAFFSECLDFKGKKKSERISQREDWFAKSLVAMAGNDIVCVDPDNGLVVPSAIGKPKENKYVLPEELASYYAQSSTVIFYQHKARRKDSFYANQLRELLRREDLPGASGLALKFEKVSQRYYMFIIQPKHKEEVEQVVKDMLSTAWGKHFCLLTLMDA